MNPTTQQFSQIWPESAQLLERSRGVFFAYWEEMIRLKQEVIRTSNLDDIHDLRVASRRFRAALELFCPFVQNTAQAELKKGVRKLTKVLSGLRNIDEALLFFEDTLEPDVFRESKLFSSLTSSRSDEFSRIRKAVMAFDEGSLDRKVRNLIAHLTEESFKNRNSISVLAYFSEVSIKRYLPIHQLLAAAIVPEQRTSRHALRIAIKKWRYFFEIIAPILDRDYTPLLEQLKEYQTCLGRLNDIAAFEELLSDMKLPKCERKRAKSILQAEESVLLNSFTVLCERAPLTYTFLI